METIIAKAYRDGKIDRDVIAKAGSIVKAGGLVAFPTETVYGLGGDALNARSSAKIYEAKGRPSDNPLIVHIARWRQISKIVKQVPPAAKLLAERFLPGPLTMIFEKAECVPGETTGGLETVAVRFPSHPVAQAFIKEAGGFVAAPSANRSGRPSPTVAKYVIEDLDGRVDMILDGGESDIGLESTIIDLTAEKPVILRPGFITQEMLAQVLKEVEADQIILDGSSLQRPKAPGMKYRHYAPKGSLTIVEGDISKVRDYINKELGIQRKAGKITGVIATKETADEYHADSVKNIGGRQDEEAVAHNLFRILREFDEEGIEVIYAEGFESKGVGFAVMNRLLKAAGHQCIRL